MLSPIARKNRKIAGFTFVEILASMLFLTILIPTVLGALAISNRASVVSERSAVAMQLAENRLNELLARMRAQLRGYDSSEDAVFKVGPYLFRPSAKQLHDPLRNKRIRLTEKEAAILKFLYRAGGRPVPRNVLLNDVWGYNSNVTTHTLETHIYRLRQKIEPNPAETRILLTEAGGYRLEQTSEAEAG